MGLTAEQYRALFLALLPPGDIWPRGTDTTLAKLLLGLADEKARIDGRHEDLADEADPRTAFEMLEDWERTCGLPDVCSALTETLQERRAAVLAQLTAQGGQTPAHIIARAAELGFSVAITEHRPFLAGESRAGDPCAGEEWAHVFTVNAPATTEVLFRAGRSAAGEPLSKWGNDKLECAISATKPAHTHALYAYGSD